MKTTSRKAPAANSDSNGDLEAVRLQLRVLAEIASRSPSITIEQLRAINFTIGAYLDVWEVGASFYCKDGPERALPVN